MHLVADLLLKSVRLFIIYQVKIQKRVNYKLPGKIMGEQEFIRMFKISILQKLFSQMKMVK